VLILKNTVRFVFLILLQVLILNRIHFLGYINPYLYIYFLLMLPFATPRWLLLILAFFLGLGVDIFSNTPGMHAAASLAVAFIRPYLIKRISPAEEFDPRARPSIVINGLRWFITYSLILITIHHLLLFYIEIFRFSEFFQTFFRAVLSIVFTMILILISEHLLYRKK